MKHTSIMQSRSITFAINLDTKEQEQEVLLAYLGVDYKEPSQGVYKGEGERSYTIQPERAEDVKEILELADQYEQECVMINRGGDAVLMYLPNYLEKNPSAPKTINVGKLKEITKEKAKELEAFTVEPSGIIVASI